MKIEINNKIITSVTFNNSEIAWKIDDALSVLDYFKRKEKIILGGDILTEQLKHNYDSWYYDLTSQNIMFNIDQSYQVAVTYISNYIRENGTTFYVILVVR